MIGGGSVCSECAGVHAGITPSNLAIKVTKPVSRGSRPQLHDLAMLANNLTFKLPVPPTVNVPL